MKIFKRYIWVFYYILNQDYVKCTIIKPGFCPWGKKHGTFFKFNEQNLKNNKITLQQEFWQHNCLKLNKKGDILVLLFPIEPIKLNNLNLFNNQHYYSTLFIHTSLFCLASPLGAT